MWASGWSAAQVSKLLHCGARHAGGISACVKIAYPQFFHAADFHRHVALQLRVLSKIDLTHSTPCDFAHKSVLALQRSIDWVGGVPVDAIF